MPEPMEMPNIEAIVETIRVARRSEEGARMHISISVQVKDAPQLLPFLATSLKNVIKVGFTEIQARLPENPAKVETTVVKMSVDGEEAEVVIHAPGSRTILPHPFKADAETGKCAYCKRPEGYSAHEQSRIDAAKRNGNSNGHRADPDALAAQGAEREAAMQEAGKTRHAFVAHEGDNQCEACGRAAEADAHAGVAEEGDDLPPPAQYLVDEARRTPATDGEAQQQAEGEAALAGRSKA